MSPTNFAKQVYFPCGKKALNSIINSNSFGNKDINIINHHTTGITNKTQIANHFNIDSAEVDRTLAQKNNRSTCRCRLPPTIQQTIFLTPVTSKEIETIIL